jgi:hypothetical protein
VSSSQKISRFHPVCVDVRIRSMDTTRAGRSAAMWRIIILSALLLVEGCEHRRPNFMTRVREDCAAGDQWACDLLASFTHP